MLKVLSYISSDLTIFNPLEELDPLEKLERKKECIRKGKPFPETDWYPDTKTHSLPYFFKELTGWRTSQVFDSFISDLSKHFKLIAHGSSVNGTNKIPNDYDLLVISEPNYTCANLKIRKFKNLEMGVDDFLNLRNQRKLN